MQVFLRFRFFYCLNFDFFYLVDAAERENGVSPPHGVGEAVRNVSSNKFLQVVLVSPQV